MSDVIEIRGLRVLASVGVLPEEHARLQPLLLDLDVFVDLARAGASDHLEDTINYAEIVEVAVALIAERHHELLEAIADGIGRAALGLDERIEAVDVTVTKLRPPIGHDVATVGVRRHVER